MKYSRGTLGELCDVKIGRTPPRNQPEWFNSGADSDWRWVSIKDMGNCGKYITETAETITEGAKNNFNYAVASSGTVLLSFKLTLGRVVICDGDFVTNEAIAQLPIRDEAILDRDYLYYYLKNYDWANTGNTSSIGAAVNSKIVKEIIVLFPALETQKKIVRILSTLDQKIELNNQQNESIYKISEAVFMNTFLSRLRGERFIGDFIFPKRGKNLLVKDARDGSVPVVAGGLEPSAYHNKSNTLSPVITISASGVNAGYVRLWGQEVWSSDSSFIDSSITDAIYFWYVLLKYRQREIYESQTGSAQAHIYPKHIADMPLGNINGAEIKDFSDQMTPLFEKVEQNNQENKVLANLRDMLLPKLMSGEISTEKVKVWPAKNAYKR